jgi:hypothetical protein
MAAAAFYEQSCSRGGGWVAELGREQHGERKPDRGSPRRRMRRHPENHLEGEGCRASAVGGVRPTDHGSEPKFVPLEE